MSSKVDGMPLLTIIKNTSSEIIFKALNELQDNNFYIDGNDSYAKQSIKCFTSNQLQSELIKQIKQQIGEQFHDKLKECQNLIQQLYDVSKMQLCQTLGSTLFFSELSNKDQINPMLGSIYFLKMHFKHHQIKSQRVVYINLTGLDCCQNQEFIKIFKGNSQAPNQDIYFEFKSFGATNFKTKPQYQYCLNQQNNSQNKISWKEVKYILKLDIKRKLELSKYQIIILQFCLEIKQDEENQGQALIFEYDCITRITRFFQKLSKDKLFIHLILKINPNQKQILENIERQNNQQRKDLCQLKQFINAIQQGVFGNKIYNQTNNLIMQQNINQLKNYKFNTQNNQLVNEYRRIHNSFLINHKIQFNQETKITHRLTRIPIIKNDGQIKFIELLNNGNLVEYNKQSQLIINYNESILVLFQFDQFKLFCCKNDIQNGSKQKETFLIDIQIYKDDQLFQDLNRSIVPTVAILNQKIYILYGYLGCKLLEYDLNTNILTVKTKKYSSNDLKYPENQQKFKENIKQRDGASVCYNKKLFKNQIFSLIGGELGEQSKLCNLIETVNVLENDFITEIISKEQLNKYKSLRPFKDQLILEEDNYILLLPGDYNNQNYKYSQVINFTFYQQIMKLSKCANGFKWEYIDILYSDKKLQQRYPIHKFNNKQQNIMKIENHTWVACFQLFEEQSQFSSLSHQFQKIIQFKFKLMDKNLQVDVNILDENLDDNDNETIIISSQVS